MVIDDLTYFEISAEEQAITGGWIWDYVPPTANALAFADSVAVGYDTVTASNTLTQSVAGLFSRSASVSASTAVGPAMV